MVKNESVTYNQHQDSEDRSKMLNKTHSHDQMYKNNIGDREKMFMSGFVNNQNGNVENSNEKTKFIRQPSYSEFGILNYENGIFKKERTDSNNSNYSYASSSCSAETQNVGNGTSNNQNNTLNKTQSCGNIFNRNNIGNREKMFMSGIVNNVNGIQQKSNKQAMVRQPSYSEFGIVNDVNGIFKKQSTNSTNSTESYLKSNGSLEIQQIENAIINENNKILNKTQSCGNIFYRHTSNIGDREKMFLSGVMNNKDTIPENPKENNPGRKLVRQPSYVENGILNYESQNLKRKTSSSSTPSINKFTNKTQSCGNFFLQNNFGNREQMFINGIVNNNNDKNQKSVSREMVRQPSYADVGILNYEPQLLKRQASVSSAASESRINQNDMEKNDESSTKECGTFNEVKMFTKAQSCGNMFARSHIGDREKMFISGIVNNNHEIPGGHSGTPQTLVRQPSYAEVGILNYGSQTIKRQYSVSTSSNENCTSETSAKNESNQHKILAKTQSCSSILSKSDICDREKMFISGIMKNNSSENLKPVRELVRQPSYSEVGILNYDPQVVKRQYSVSTSSNKSRIDEEAAEINIPTNQDTILNKTQSCGSILSKGHIGDREKMFISGIIKNTSSDNVKPVRELVRQPSYSEVGILNYDPQVLKRQYSNSTSSNEGRINEEEAENNISTNQDKFLAKTKSCGSIPSKSHIGDREKMFISGILNNTSSENLQPVRELIRQPSYSEVGILNYDSQVFKRQSSFSSTSSDGNFLEGLRGEFNNHKSCNETSGKNGSPSSVNEGSMNSKVDSPARSRIIARVKKSRSFALLQDTMKEVPVLPAASTSERQVLVIYTGGTIGMVKNSDGVLAPIKGAFENTARSFPQLHDEAYWCKRFVYDDDEKQNLVLPVVKDLDARIIYKICEKETLLDSANITAEDWIAIARDIKMKYDLYDGFVILHGTDTLAYTASALSFMLENIGKPIVITGSQIPIFEPRSDGADNFVSALIVAGGLNIPEVTVMFDSKLLRGNRTHKISSHDFDAFNSPNFVPLVEFGIDIEVNSKAIFRPTKIEKMHLHEKMCKNVGILRIFPSISSALLRAFFQPPIEGVVLETYGSGNIPSNGEIFKEIEAAVKRGVIVVNVTQCASGSVTAPVYETGRLIHACGVISGYDMTSETALAKLAYVLSKEEWSHQKKIEMMTSNIRGELTNMNSITIEDNSLIDALASSLKITSPKQLIEVTDRVLTSLLLYAIDKEEEVTIQTIQELGAEVNSQNSEGKTPLHEAINKENLNIVKYLLLRGANVHVKTKSGESPLLTAIQRDQHAIIKLLLNCGAHLASSDNQVVAELLSLAARRGSVQRLQSLRLAGADFDLRDEMRQTALHKAVLSNEPEAVRYLLDHNAQKNVLDVLNLTPLEYARQLDNKEIIKLLE